MGVLIRNPGLSLMAALLVALAALQPCAAAGKANREHQIKAAFLYNFIKFVSWPADGFADDHSPIELCILGHELFDSVIDIVPKGKRVRGRPIAVRQIQKTSDSGKCHLLFIGTSASDRLSQIVDYVSGRPILTVADGGDFAARGGIINLVVVGNKVRFEINPRAAHKAGLQLSAQLLKLALIVDR